MELNEIKKLENSFILNNINFCKLKSMADYLIDKAYKDNKKICIQIRYFNKIIVLYCMDGLTVDNENWVRRKANSAEHFSSSTLFLNIKNNNDPLILINKYGLNVNDYCIVPGAYPLYQNNVGLVGSIAISGMSPEEDDEYAIDGLKWYINKY